MSVSALSCCKRRRIVSKAFNNSIFFGLVMRKLHYTFSKENLRRSRLCNEILVFRQFKDRRLRNMRARLCSHTVKKSATRSKNFAVLLDQNLKTWKMLPEIAFAGF